MNPNCIPGFKRVYGFDPSGSFVKLAVADAGIEALDDGLAEVAVAFSSNPELSRPDILTLRDDKHTITPDHIVPVVRTTLLRRYGRGLRRTLNAASAGRLDVQLAAPGENILSTANTGGYVYLTGTSMAAPMVSGVAALVAALNPSLSAQDLRAVLLQNATRSRLPISAGYVDALGSVRAAATAVGYDTTQAPRLRILAATSKRGRIAIQAAVSGSSRAIRRYRVSLDGHKVAQLAGRPSPFSLTLRRHGRRVRIQALGPGGRALAAASRNVTGLRAGKRGVNRGHGVGT